MLYDSDFDPDALEEGAILFWGVPGPRTGVAVVVAARASELLAWLADRATVEGPASPLARALPAVSAVARAEGDDGELVADALAGALEDHGVAVFALGPLARELLANDLVRLRVWSDVSPEDVVPDTVWRGGEAHSEASGLPVSRPELEAEPEKGYRLDEDLEEWAEHEERLHLDRAEFREFVAERLESLRLPPGRRAA